MKSIDKLREMVKQREDGWLKLDLLKLADEIEAEIAERYVELPLDADGVKLVPEMMCRFIENVGEGCWSKEHRDGKCSECGSDMKGRYNYCPSCGAKVVD